MKTLIIAEIGINHNGRLSLAKKLISAAAKTGADYVKFQTFEPENVVIKSAKLAKYQKRNMKKNISQLKMLKKYQIKKKFYDLLIKFSKKKKINFISSPFDVDSIKFLSKLKLNFLKIPSGEINNFPYLKEIAKLKKKLILSTGMSSLREVDQAIKILIKFGTKKKNISLLHCHTDYPSMPENLNLKSILTLKKKFKLKVGYSDHSQGIEAAIASVALGAEVIEKHLTLNNKMSGPDHKASIDPITFRDMVIGIRNTEKMLGNGKKKPTQKELHNKKFVRKSLVAKKSIKKGDRFTVKNMTTKRPALGISPMKYQYKLNKIAKKNYSEDDYI